MPETNDVPASLAKWILLAVLAVISLGLIVPAATIYMIVVGEWADSASGFHGIDGAVGWLFGLCSAAAIGAGLLIAGIMIRMLHSQWAPLASLGLAIVSAGFIIATYLVFSDTGNGSDSIEVFFLMVCSVVSMLVVALPPFLHWALAKPKPVIIEPPRAGQ
ncbi:MAG: hypothetical protein JWL86_1656 [Rhizobium sp.]|nr:hypothetical protein [Rhizobium sp.]